MRKMDDLRMNGKRTKRRRVATGGARESASNDEKESSDRRDNQHHPLTSSERRNKVSEADRGRLETLARHEICVHKSPAICVHKSPACTNLPTHTILRDERMRSKG